jgi:hypothetical protein
LNTDFSIHTVMVEIRDAKPPLGVSSQKLLEDSLRSENDDTDQSSQRPVTHILSNVESPQTCSAMHDKEEPNRRVEWSSSQTGGSCQTFGAVSGGFHANSKPSVAWPHPQYREPVKLSGKCDRHQMTVDTVHGTPRMRVYGYRGGGTGVRMCHC